RPANPKELFNLWHSQCCNVIEHIFGLQRNANEFPIAAQGQIASAICVLHKFICIHDPQDLVADEEDTQIGHPSSQVNVEEENRGIPRAEAEAAKKLRDKIANDMWLQY
ncbi:hypothetical protein M422DRAFT_145225, partial [Sphaerobolus stellatus SS14]